MSAAHPGSGGSSTGAGAVRAGVAQQPQPRDGDLVVVRTSGADGPFSVEQVPGEAQFRTSTRSEAVHLARGFAQRHAVDLWYADQHTYALLEPYRPATVTAGDGEKG